MTGQNNRVFHHIIRVEVIDFGVNISKNAIHIYIYIYNIYSYIQEIQHNIDKLKQIHINAVGKKK